MSQILNVSALASRVLEIADAVSSLTEPLVYG